jgi:hypothetical protein
VTDSFSTSISEQCLISWTRTSLIEFKPLVATPVQIASLLLIMQGSVIQFSYIPEIPYVSYASLTSSYTFDWMIQLCPNIFAALLCFIGFWPMPGRQQLSRTQRFTPFVVIVIFVLTRLPWFDLLTFLFCDYLTGVCWSFIWWRYIGEFYADKSPVRCAIWRVS